MEPEKRKLEDDGEISDGQRSKDKRVFKGVEAVKDEEVEEFFAILRRIQVAVKYFQKNKGMRRTPSFRKEDFDEVNGDVERRRKEEDRCVDYCAGLDLNSDPPLDENSV